MESPGDRRLNITDAFECRADVQGKRYMLIDDVITTGSTMSACADSLKNSGAANVWGLAFARQGVLPDDDGYNTEGSRLWT